jgi:regulator of PEP synthase PpsR (kinase-PPPase family)
VAEERNIQRTGLGEVSKYIADGIRTVYEHLQKDIPTLENQGWVIVDTTNKNIEATVKHILLQVK